MADINQPDNLTPLEDWLGTVVSFADGRHSIAQLIDYVGGQYADPPANLQKTLYSVIERLLEGKLISLCNSVVTLPYYLAEPIENLDLKVARLQVEEDGFNAGLSH